MKRSHAVVLPFVLVSGFLWAEVDRSRLKEKQEKPGVELGKPGEAEGEKARKEHEKLHQDLAREGKANLQEIARLMKMIQNNLAQKQTGQATQTEQKEVVIKIQKLIEKLEKG